MNNTELLYKPFDIQVHKKNFIHYLEVVIDTEGTAHYAVPSHQEWLIRRSMELLGITDQDTFYGLCPSEYYCDYMDWLTRQCGCIPVWENYYIGQPTPLQRRTLSHLKLAGLYLGEI